VRTTCVKDVFRVTLLAPTYEPPLGSLPDEHGVQAVLEVLLDDGRVLDLLLDDLPRALVALHERQAVLSDDLSLSLDPLPDLADDGGGLTLRLRVGARGPEVVAQACTADGLDRSIALAWAAILDAAYAWGSDALVGELRRVDGAWARHVFEATGVRPIVPTVAELAEREARGRTTTTPADAA
jgi:hypothetical protein